MNVHTVVSRVRTVRPQAPGNSARLQVDWFSARTIAAIVVVVALSLALARPNGRVTYTFEFLSWIYLGSAVALLGIDRINRGRLHPVTPLLAGLTVMGLLECAFDSVVYVIYDPEFRIRTPDIFPFDLAPYPIPITMVVGYGFYFALPVLAAVAIAKQMPTRHPVRTAFFVGVAMGTIPTLVFEQLLVKARIYSYLQTIPGWAVRGGDVTQTRIDMVIVMALFLGTISALWAWRDPNGEWMLASWSQRASSPATRALRLYLGSAALICAVYALTMIPFQIEKALGLVNQVSTHQPYGQLMPYNPDGLP